MPKMMKICRVCGRSYEACRTVGKPGVFRWQDVACSPECGAIYLQKLKESRGGVSKPDEKPISQPVAEPVVEQHEEPQAKQPVHHKKAKSFEGEKAPVLPTPAVNDSEVKDAEVNEDNKH